MKNNDTGEFELVVGDRQLLSAFFIVVLLCAVAFAMGYVVGQNAPKSGKPLELAWSAHCFSLPRSIFQNVLSRQRRSPLPGALQLRTGPE